ncbi:uncharacterized protein BX663DRAFT_507156 [Cokeromyces recurvatus]|uniref:uncharacterized protein n=1 Tax=Cokeromyces recurvatus TaxID=90255 RepID=UPI0022211522|nr:uncharacterized protein BX663DRAFT_507156 [Cokeromyces recurvatus]KAI7903636.1 hypothetical protein BX663DRAFT_507156 [Cokeromyces recurvatus]
MAEVLHKVDSHQIKNFYIGQKHNRFQHYVKYDYCESPSIEEEINEFIPYSEVKFELKEYKKEYSNWQTDKKNIIIQDCCNHLDFVNDEQRIKAAKCLVYISLGNYGDHQDLIESMRQNNQLLFDFDIIPVLKQSLNHACHQLETVSITNSNSMELITLYCKEIDLYLTILFMVLIFNKEKESLKKYKLVEFLFDLIVRLKEHFTRTFPLKKLMMILHKALLITLGNPDDKKEYDELKATLREIYGLPKHDNHKFIVKCQPEDLHHFIQQSTERYPTFTPPNKITEKITINPLTITASSTLTKAMGLSKASEGVDLPYHTLFPSKNQQQQQQHYQLNGNNKRQPQTTEAHLLPFTKTSAVLPFSLSEASSVWINHLYISTANYQIIHEREKAIHRWERWNEDKQQDDEDEDRIWINQGIKSEDQRNLLNRIHHIYQSIVPNFQSIVVVFLKLLLSTVTMPGKDKEAEIVEDINMTRHRETISKAVSSILLLLLKWFKISHVLKFEYLGQVLIDSGCMLLILKLLGLQEVASLASKRTDTESLSFFGSFKEMNREEEEEEGYVNKRNLCWPINLLRILQMLTKRKMHRILLLVQYKSAAILKRLLKVGHPVLELYVLKNLKNQIPFLGRKWRTGNMKTISAIYAHCVTSLNDDWLSCPEGCIDIEESAAEEINLRMLIRLYNGQRYLPHLIPSMDEVNGPNSTVFYKSNDKRQGLPDYTLNELLKDDFELDNDFKQNYRTWLEKDIYSTEEEEEQEEKEKDWKISTPIPNSSPVSISPEDITREINKLYIEELSREFKDKINSQTEDMKNEKEEDGWDKAIDYNSQMNNPWIESSSSISSEFFNDDDDEEEEIDNKEETNNPLKGINWNNLTEEELKRRLALVEEKTVQRWLNVDMNDPRYMKVLNTFEDEEGVMPLDDEGWPI